MFKTNELRRLTKENVQKSLEVKGYNDIDLCRYYITGFKKVGVGINSDLRVDDKNASLHTKSHNGRIIISDFGYRTGMDIFNYLQLKYFSNDKKGFMQTLDMVCKDFHLDDISSYYYRTNYSKKIKTVPIKHHITMSKAKDIILNIKSRAWNEEDVKFWKLYGLTLEDFTKSNIIMKPLSKFRIINETRHTVSEIELKNNLSYAYCIFVKGQWYYKIYSPYGIDGKGTMKWVSNIRKNVLIGVTKPKNTDLLIIQSSIKDKVLIDKMGYYSLPLLAEGIWFEKDIWAKLRKTFKTIIYFANNDWRKEDNPGLKIAKQHWGEYDINHVLTTPNIKNVTDISDYTKKYNFDRAKLLVDKLIKKTI